MPKEIEVTVQLNVHKVTCPGVWLCQDGKVSMTIFALGNSFQTRLVPSLFPLVFRDIFYFRKRFQEDGALNKICCLLQDETIYCELVQWSHSKCCSECCCVILAQYLGALNDILFPPNVCSSDGVDLLMRRTKDFPGILSPKIEITTKVRIDEVFTKKYTSICPTEKIIERPQPPPERDHFSEKSRFKRSGCHSAKYHGSKCSSRDETGNSERLTRSRSKTPNQAKSRSMSMASFCSLTRPSTKDCSCVNVSPCRPRTPPVHDCVHAQHICAMPAHTKRKSMSNWSTIANIESSYESEVSGDDDLRTCDDYDKLTLESRYIDRTETSLSTKKPRIIHKVKPVPCLCDICKKYHAIFN